MSAFAVERAQPQDLSVHYVIPSSHHAHNNSGYDEKSFFSEPSQMVWNKKGNLKSNRLQRQFQIERDAQSSANEFSVNVMLENNKKNPNNDGKRVSFLEIKDLIETNLKKSIPESVLPASDWAIDRIFYYDFILNAKILLTTHTAKYCNLNQNKNEKKKANCVFEVILKRPEHYALPTTENKTTKVDEERAQPTHHHHHIHVEEAMHPEGDKYFEQLVQNCMDRQNKNNKKDSKKEATEDSVGPRYTASKNQHNKKIVKAALNPSDFFFRRAMTLRNCTLNDLNTKKSSNYNKNRYLPKLSSQDEPNNTNNDHQTINNNNNNNDNDSVPESLKTIYPYQKCLPYYYTLFDWQTNDNGEGNATDDHPYSTTNYGLVYPIVTEKESIEKRSNKDLRLFENNDKNRNAEVDDAVVFTHPRRRSTLLLMEQQQQEDNNNDNDDKSHDKDNTRNDMVNPSSNAEEEEYTDSDSAIRHPHHSEGNVDIDDAVVFTHPRRRSTLLLMEQQQQEDNNSDDENSNEHPHHYEDDVDIDDAVVFTHPRRRSTLLLMEQAQQEQEEDNSNDNKPNVLTFDDDGESDDYQTEEKVFQRRTTSPFTSHPEDPTAMTLTVVEIALSGDFVKELYLAVCDEHNNSQSKNIEKTLSDINHAFIQDIYVSLKDHRIAVQLEDIRSLQKPNFMDSKNNVSLHTPVQQNKDSMRSSRKKSSVFFFDNDNNNSHNSPENTTRYNKKSSFFTTSTNSNDEDDNNYNNDKNTTSNSAFSSSNHDNNNNRARASSMILFLKQSTKRNSVMDTVQMDDSIHETENKIDDEFEEIVNFSFSIQHVSQFSDEQIQAMIIQSGFPIVTDLYKRLS